MVYGVGDDRKVTSIARRQQRNERGRVSYESFTGNEYVKIPALRDEAN